MHKIFINPWFILAGAVVLAAVAILAAGPGAHTPQLIPIT
jgi:hypothetical protein